MPGLLRGNRVHRNSELDSISSINLTLFISEKQRLEAENMVQAEADCESEWFWSPILTKTRADSWSLLTS